MLKPKPKKKKKKHQLTEEESFRDHNLPMMKDEISFANSGMNLFAQESAQVELLKIFKKFLERSQKFLAQTQNGGPQEIATTGLKTKKDQSLALVNKNKKFSEDIETVK